MAVLGEVVYLGCRFLGTSKVESASWRRRKNSRSRTKPLAGFSKDGPFSNDDIFSEPDSLTNLSVKMNVSSVDVEGEYICQFESAEEEFFESVFVTVVGKSKQ